MKHFPGFPQRRPLLPILTVLVVSEQPGTWSAWCLDLDLASKGPTAPDAVQSLVTELGKASDAWSGKRVPEEAWENAGKAQPYSPEGSGVMVARVCPECGGKVVFFRGSGVNMEEYLCSRWQEVGHPSKEEIAEARGQHLRKSFSQPFRFA
jgi:hypothetical protein